jgi:hypothetical protein
MANMRDTVAPTIANRIFCPSIVISSLLEGVYHKESCGVKVSNKDERVETSVPNYHGSFVYSAGSAVGKYSQQITNDIYRTFNIQNP